MEIKRRIELLVKQRRGAVVDAHAALFDDDLALGRDDRVVDDEIGHAVGFELHHQLEPVGGDVLEIGRVVMRGEGVLLAAILRDDAREIARRHRLGAAEHQMLEEMRGARFADDLVGGADLVPDHLRHDRRAMIGDDDDLQPVRQREALRVEELGLRRPGHAGTMPRTRDSRSRIVRDPPRNVGIVMSPPRASVRTS